MDQNTSALAEDVTRSIHNGEAIAANVVVLEPPLVMLGVALREEYPVSDGYKLARARLLLHGSLRPSATGPTMNVDPRQPRGRTRLTGRMLPDRFPAPIRRSPW
jgi:hypothetical protein